MLPTQQFDVNDKLRLAMQVYRGAVTNAAQKCALDPAATTTTQGFETSPELAHTITPF